MLVKAWLHERKKCDCYTADNGNGMYVNTTHHLKWIESANIDQLDNSHQNVSVSLSALLLDSFE